MYASHPTTSSIISQPAFAAEVPSKAGVFTAQMFFTSAATAIACVSMCERVSHTWVAPTSLSRAEALHERCLARAVVNGNGSPVQVLADARGEAFRNSFLGGPARRIVLVRVFKAVAVGLLLLGEDAFEEAVAVLREHTADALDLDEVAAKADQDAAGGKDDAHGESSG